MQEKKNHYPLIYDCIVFLSIVCILILIGFVFVYSSSSVYALEKFGSADYFIKKQCFGIALGWLAFSIIQFFPMRFFNKSSRLIFFAILLITLSVVIIPFSVTIHGARRWIYLNGISIQPSELLKVWFFIYFCSFLTHRMHKFDSWRKTFFPFVAIVIMTCLVLLKQPDFGTAFTLVCTAGIVYFICGCSIKQLMMSALFALPSLFILIFLYPYRLKRILTFLDPWQDPQGAGFQIIQSLIAIGSGGFFGAGISHSKQKFFYLPMQHTDFIFSIIAEETGFIGSITIACLYFALLYVGFRIAFKLQNTFNQLLIISFSLLVTLQATINIAVTAGMIPTKGIGLPFISYGNSSLISFMIFLGIVVKGIREELLSARKPSAQRYNKPLIDFA